MTQLTDILDQLVELNRSLDRIALLLEAHSRPQPPIASPPDPLGQGFPPYTGKLAPPPAEITHGPRKRCGRCGREEWLWGSCREAGCLHPLVDLPEEDDAGA